MKISRFIAALGALALLGFIVAASPRVVGPYQVHFITGNGGQLDSTIFSPGGAAGGTATIDTSAVISAQEFSWTTGGAAPGTAQTLAGICVYSTSGTVASTDTMFVALDASPTATGPWSNGAFVGMVAATANDGAIFGRLLFTPGLNSAVNGPYLAPYLRLRFRPDGSASPVFPSAKAQLFRHEWNK